MSNDVDAELIDGENPEWTEGEAARAVPFSELSAELQGKLLAAKRHRGPQKAPTKQKISVRVSPDVLGSLRERGRGWQSHVDEALREWLERHPA